MSLQLHPEYFTSVTLSNPAWAFIGNMLRSVPAGTLADAGQEGIITALVQELERGKQPPPQKDEAE